MAKNSRDSDAQRVVEYYNKAARRQGEKDDFSFLGKEERIGPKEGYVATGRKLSDAVDKKLHGGRLKNMQRGRPDGASLAGGYMTERDGLDGEIYVKLPSPAQESKSKSNSQSSQPPPAPPVKKPETPYVAQAVAAKTKAQAFQQQGASQSQPQGASQAQQQGGSPSGPASAPQGDPSRSNPVDASGYSTAQRTPDQIVDRLRSYGDGLAQQSKQDGQDFANSAQERVNAYNAAAANMDARAGEAPKPLSADEQFKIAKRARDDANDLLGARNAPPMLARFFNMSGGRSTTTKNRNTA